ncbi:MULTISPECIES: FHA domain-containing protein [unclassified Agromyces]|uniref:FHA domain-containing protein n=1 Tax=unclassified Agromyces TaxID=2639701 RepID=UPI00301570E4
MHRSESGVISIPVPGAPGPTAPPTARPITAPPEAVAIPPQSAGPGAWPGEPAAPARPSEPQAGIPQPEPATWELRFTTGEVVTVSGTGLVGRRPMPQPGERFSHLVQIVDRGLSVSKTHLEFGEHDGRLWVADRFSSNGTVVRRPGEGGVRCEPGRRVLVPRGSRVEIGEQAFTVA